MKYVARKSVFALFLMVMLVANQNISLAHSGKTDSSGGHYDYNNASGLGSYHYHCGGYPPHLHSNGACPYNGTSSSPDGNSNSFIGDFITKENVDQYFDFSKTGNRYQMVEMTFEDFIITIMNGQYTAGKEVKEAMEKKQNLLLEEKYSEGYRKGKQDGIEVQKTDSYKYYILFLLLGVLIGVVLRRISNSKDN